MLRCLRDRKETFFLRMLRGVVKVRAERIWVRGGVSCVCDARVIGVVRRVLRAARGGGGLTGAALLVAALASPAAAQVEDAAAALARAAPGAVAATWTPDGTAVAARGFRRWDRSAPMEAGDAVHVGSLGKAMTATLAGRMVARGVIGWDDTVGGVLGVDGPYANATLEQLLTHRSGMPRNGGVARLFAWSPEMAKRAALLAPPGAPRGSYLYSNAGYVLAGAMLEAAGGADWEALMRREVFAPLGMAGAGFGAPPDAWGHRGGAPVPPGPAADNPPVFGPAGRIHLTAEDMLRFLEAHATRDPDYLPPAIWDRLHRPVDDYAMGWTVEDGTWSHNGTNTFWYARMAFQEGRAAFVAVNRGDGDVATATERALGDLMAVGP